MDTHQTRREYEWFRASPLIAGAANLGGILMLAFGGLTAWAQRSFGRVMACGLAVEIGALLIQAGLGTVLSIEAIAIGIGARAISFGLLALGVSLLRQEFGSDEFDALRGAGRRLVWAPLAIGIGGLSLAGLPGTIGFVSRWMSIRSLALGDQELMMLSILASPVSGSRSCAGWARCLRPRPHPRRRTPRPPSRWRRPAGWRPSASSSPMYGPGSRPARCTSA